MIWVPLTVLVGLYFTFDWIRDNISVHDRGFRRLAYIVSVPVVICIGGSIGWLFGWFCGAAGYIFLPVDYEVVYDYPIVSILNSSEYEDKFVVGFEDSGNLRYMYYVADTDDGRVLQKTRDDCITIVESDKVGPSIHLEKVKWKYSFIEFFAFDIRYTLEPGNFYMTVPSQTILKEMGSDIEVVYNNKIT